MLLKIQIENESQPDLEHNKFWYWGTNVISERGELSYFVMTYEDFVFTVLSDGSGNAIMPLNYTGSLGVPHDTIAYIPNAVVREARTKIAAAFAAENYAECYRLFDEAYIFVPTTGPQVTRPQSRRARVMVNTMI